MSIVNQKKIIPFEFVLEELFEVSPRIKPMFGAFAIYVNEKIVFILREKSDYLMDNGVWLATTLEHHAELQKIFPHMRSITVFGSGPTGWQVLPLDAPDFEESVIKACQMVLKKDPKIGKIPQSKLSKTRKKIKVVKKVKTLKKQLKVKKTKQKLKPISKKKNKVKQKILVKRKILRKK